MKKSTTNNTSREVIFTESKTMREEYVKEEYYDIHNIFLTPLVVLF